MSSQRRRTFISGIFNYCDRWCDRCRFTEVCRLFYDEQRAMSRARRKGKDPDSFDTTLAMMDASFKRTTRLIKRWAKKEGIDLNEMVTPEVEAEVSRSRQSHAQTREHPLCQAANSYREAAHALLKRLSPLFDEARENAIERAQIMDVQGEAATLAKVRDAFDAIAWDHTMLMVKTHRAMNSLAEANRALVQFRGAGENLRRVLAPDSPLRNDLDQALQQLAGAAESISALVDFLKQHPNALIVGREILPKKP